MNDKQKEALFGIWEKIGISAEHLKYLGISSISPKQYFELLQEYLGIEPDTAVGSNRTYFQNLEEYIIRGVNRKFFPDYRVHPPECGDYKVKLFRLNIDKFINSSFSFSAGSKLQADFMYSKPDNFECPDKSTDEFCFDEYCLEPLVFPIGKYLSNTYGINVNYEMLQADKEGHMFKLVSE